MKTKNRIAQEVMEVVAQMGAWSCALGLFDCLVWFLKIFFEQGHYY